MTDCCSMYSILMDYMPCKQYEKVLRQEYPGELLQKYTTEVNQMARHTADRKHYKELVSILRAMRNITGGDKAVREITLHWRSAYGNRPAMMDELNRL